MKNILAILIFLALAMNAQADGVKCDSANEAENYWKTGERSTAVTCIEAVILAKGGDRDARAHYLKGKFALHGNDLATAKMKFDSDLVRRYANDIYDDYVHVAGLAISNGRFAEAGHLYEEGLRFKPENRAKIVGEMINHGKASKKIGYFDIAFQLDPARGPEIGKYLLEKGRSTKNERERIVFYNAAEKFDPSCKPAVMQDKENAGREHLALAKVLAVKPGYEKRTEEEKALAREYFKGTPSEGAVERELPEVVKYNPRPEIYVFSLKKGEQTNHWVYPDVYKTNFFYETGCLYEVLWEDNHITSMLERRSMTTAMKMKFRALTDCTQNQGGIGLQVK